MRTLVGTRKALGSRRVTAASRLPQDLPLAAVHRGPQRRPGAAAAQASLGRVHARRYLHLLDGDLGEPLKVPPSLSKSCKRRPPTSARYDPAQWLTDARAQKIRCGYPVKPERPFFCTRKGMRWDEGNVRERVLDAGARLASEKLVENGLPPLPHVTLHTMRRTYVSVMLLATNFDVPFVQSQVGHSDSKLTMDVYAQLLDRSKRAHGAAFDALLADAQETLYGAQSGEFGPQFGPPSDFGPSADISPSSEFGSDTGETDDGRGGFRTCDLSRVKRALSH
jgi:hypothetical protein